MEKGVQLSPDMTLVEVVENEIPGYVCAVVDDPKLDTTFEGRTCVIALYKDTWSVKPRISEVTYVFEPFQRRVVRRVPRQMARDGKGNIIYQGMV